MRDYIDICPESIFFIHGPKSSGKTTLLYRFLDEIEKKQKLDVKFLNLREKLIANYKDFIRIFFGIDYSKTKADIKEKWEYGIFKFFKVSVEESKGIEAGQVDPFEMMKIKLVKLRKKGIKPVIIIDELQALDEIYMNNGKDRADIRDFVKEGLDKDEIENLLRDAVRNNILYFDPVDALFYPQARSYQWGIQLYFETLT